jgi:hypothetical protein
MIIGIVGSEGAKFTFSGKTRAYQILLDIIDKPSVEEVVSGKCHLGGIDIWAIEIAKSCGKAITEFAPEHLSWEFYKKRNLLITRKSDVLHCITVDKLPDDFKGMRHSFCYHCKTDTHVKSGGCWTMKQAKVGILHIVKNS